MGSTIPILELMPVGFRFRPTDEELVDHYLKHMLQGDDFPIHVIPILDLCKIEPWDIPACSVIKSDDPEWYFFNPLVNKYSNSIRCDRATQHGFWKVTGKKRNIKTRGTNNVIGTKKTLVFYQRPICGKPVKSNWVIHEYHHATAFDVTQRNLVLCRLIYKAGKNAEGEEADASICDEGKEGEEGEEANASICDEGEPSTHLESDYENQVGTLPEVNLESVFHAPPQAEEYDFPSTQQSPISIERDAFFLNSPFLNAYCRNENSTMQCPFETSEEEEIIEKTSEEEDNGDEFVNSILADEDVASSSEYRVSKIAKSSRGAFLALEQYNPTPDDFVSRRVAARRSQTQRLRRKFSFWNQKKIRKMLKILVQNSLVSEEKVLSSAWRHLHQAKAYFRAQYILSK